ncbi:MAG: hypothetical protein WDW20_06135 [Neisseriaceae bacterium]
MKNKKLTVEDELPSYASIDLDVRVLGVRIDYLMIAIIPIFLLPLFLFVLFPLLGSDIPRKAFLLWALAIPAWLFLRIFDNKNSDLKLFYLYFYWAIKKKNTQFFNGNAFLPNKPSTGKDKDED